MEYRVRVRMNAVIAVGFDNGDVTAIMHGLLSVEVVGVISLFYTFEGCKCGR